MTRARGIQVEPFLAARITHVAFCAHDDDETFVQWSEIEGMWIVNNKKGQKERFGYLCHALTNMHIRTASGLGSEDYRLCVPRNWTITEQF